MAVRTNGNSIRVFAAVAEHSGPYTVTFWTKYHTLADGGLISLNQGVSTATEDAITALSGGNTQLMTVGGSGGTTNVNADPATTSATWYHWALVRENATTLKMYVDSVVRATTTSDVSGRATSDHFAFARRGDFGGSDIECAALKVWNGVALSAGEVAQELPYRNPQTNVANCVLAMPFVDAGTWLSAPIKAFGNTIFDDGATSVSTVSDPAGLLGDDPLIDGTSFLGINTGFIF